MKKAFILFALIIATLSVFAQPKGIYVLDSKNGTFRDANIRNYAFVDGYVWRTSWSEIETSKGVYNFDGINHIVQRLDSIDKKLTILFGAYSVEPSYIALEQGVTTYLFTDPVSLVTTTRAVPYDGFLLERFRIFLSSLANHQIYSLSTKTMVALKDHPVLANIATNIPGLGAIRNVNGLNIGLQTVMPNYTRSKFVDSLLISMKIQTDNFPTKNVFIPSYKNTNDNITSTALATYIRTRLLLSFDGVKNPKISFWQENLAGYTDTLTKVFTGLPTTTFATPLVQLGNSAYTMFQMLQGWTTPFGDPAKTANSTPLDAINYAKATYNASYFEIYVSDIDNPFYQPSFSAWQASKTETILAVDNKTISIGATENSTSTVNVTSNTAWAATCSQPWLQISPMSGSGNARLVLTAAVNTLLTNRAAIITVTAGDSVKTISVTQDAGLSSNVNAEGGELLSIYPNPVFESFKIAGNIGNATISIFHSNGCTLLKKEILGNENVAVQHLPKGIYLVEIATENARVFRKMIKK